jgi:microcystin-dependent protein
VRIDSSERVGIKKLNPDEVLDVTGNIKTDGKLIVVGDENATNLSTGSITTTGGASVTKTLFVGDGINVSNSSTLETILPKTHNTYNLGSDTNRWNSIFANEIRANTFTGNFSGFLTGNISGSATSLVNSTVFSLGDRLDGTGTIIQASDVVSSGVSFNGSAAGGNVVLTGIIASTFITNKTAVLDSFGTDEIILSRGGNLRKSTKNTFLRNVPTVPTGAIFPFAGSIVPTGYLLCDGSEQLIANYPELFSTIQYNYKPLSLLTGVATFAIPDLRGRFPLGRDNMGNGGDSSANRVTDIVADTVGAGTNTGEFRSLAIENLPDHKHNLNSGNAQYYASGLPGAGADSAADPGLGMPESSTGSGLRNSGNMISSQTGQPFNAMNPYLTTNYIIFTGVI